MTLLYNKPEQELPVELIRQVLDGGILMMKSNDNGPDITLSEPKKAIQNLISFPDRGYYIQEPQMLVNGVSVARPLKNKPAVNAYYAHLNAEFEICHRKWQSTTADEARFSNGNCWAKEDHVRDFLIALNKPAE